MDSMSFSPFIPSVSAEKQDFKTHKRRRVIWLKYMLLTATAVLFIALFFWPKIDSWIHPETAPTIQKNEGKIALSNTLTDPKMHGSDDKGRPYTMTAKTAHQVTEDEAILDHPSSELNLDDGAKLSLRAEMGTYRAKDKKIHYENNVVFASPDKGFQFTTPKASIDLGQGIADGHEPIVGVTQNGTIHAQKGFRIEDKGNRLIFKGPTQLILSPNDRKKKNPDPLKKD